MTDKERTELILELRPLETFRYTEREANFLWLAALHSGCFLRPQFLQFIGTGRGTPDHKLIEKATAAGHVSGFFLHGGRHGYIVGKSIFRKLGEGDNRNRRIAEAATMKARLMGLDYVLEHLTLEYFPTETDRIELFRDRFGVSIDVLPSWTYRSPADPAKKTERYFVDKPIVAIDPAAPETVRIGFVDPGFHTADEFQTFLRKYRPLLSALKSVRLVYLASFDAAIERGQRVFERDAQPSTEEKGPNVDDLLSYFAFRNRWESGVRGFTQKQIDAYAEQKKRFRAARYEGLFPMWKQDGEAKLRGMFASATARQHSAISFEGYIIRRDFRLIGSAMMRAPKGAKSEPLHREIEGEERNGLTEGRL